MITVATKNMIGVSAINSRRQVLQFLALYIPVFFFVHTNTVDFYISPNQFHRSAASTYVEASERYQLTLTGVLAREPNIVEIRYLEHTLFAYLNDVLTPKKLQISSVEIDVGETKFKDTSSQLAFTVVSSTTAAASMNRRKEDIADPQDLSESDDKERELLHQQQKGSSANKLFVEVVVSGRDYSMLEGRFKTSIKVAINVGHKGLLKMLVAPAQAEEYFKGVSWIGAIIIPHKGSASNVKEIDGYDNKEEPAQKDPSDLFIIDNQGDAEQGITMTKASTSTSTSTSLNSKLSENDTSVEGTEEKRIKPMHERAARFRMISGSIFISLCITVVLVNTLRVANRKREERKRRMAKAKQAYEGPKEAVTSIRGSEKFVGMLDDEAIPTR